MEENSILFHVVDEVDVTDFSFLVYFVFVYSGTEEVDEAIASPGGPEEEEQ